MLNIHATTHAAAPREPYMNAKMEKLKRPSIALAGTAETWSYFLTRWGEYKRGTKLIGSDIVTQLLECCEEDLRKDLTRAAGKSLVDSEEEDVLSAMRALAVRAENTMVARVTLSNMRQGHEEPIRSFYARLKGQADTCKYEMNCTKEGCNQVNDFTEDILRDVIARGIADQEIQLDLLGEKNQNMPLRDMIEYIEAKESGKRSASRLLGPQSTDAVSSSYRRGKQQDTRTKGGTRTETSKVKPEGTCIYCGETGHGKTPQWRTRRAECPAYGKTCRKCSRQNHFDKACLGGRSPRPPPEETDGVCDEQQTAAFVELCTLTASSSNDKIRTLPLAHHLYDDMCDKWTRRPSNPQPYIHLTITIEREDYKALGLDLQKRTRAVTLPAMADTGCQSCLIGVKVAQRLGLSTEDLIPVSMTMKAANDEGIRILGAAVVRFAGTSSDARRLETRQIAYVTDTSDRIFLSRTACVDLGMISDKFPTLGEVNLATSDPCDCPQRAEPPTRPTTLPMPATEANREALRKHLLGLYAQSTFNTNLKEKTLRYRFRIVHVPGMKNRAADAMSRRPVGTLCPSPMDLPDDNAAMVTHLSPSTHADVLSLIRLTGPVNDEVEEGDLTWCAAGLESLRSVTWDRVKEATCSDDDMRALEEIAADGFPESRTGMPVAIRNFHQYREDITSADGVVLYKDRVIIPPSLRGESCVQPGDTCGGVWAHPAADTSTCGLSPPRFAASFPHACGASPGHPLYSATGLCGPLGPFAAGCVASYGVTPVHQESRLKAKMADDLDRVRISAAELRAQVTHSGKTSSSQRVQDDDLTDRQQKPQKSHKKRDVKRPDLQRYYPSGGRRHQDGEEGDLLEDHDPVESHKLPKGSRKMADSQESTDGGAVSNKRNDDRVRDRAVARDNQKSTANSKRYSKTDMRRSRNRTYSSSSASSVASLDCPGAAAASRRRPKHKENHNKMAVLNKEGRRRHLRSWTTNGDSDTESLDGSENSDVAEDRRRAAVERSAERPRSDRNASNRNKEATRGVLKVPFEKQTIIAASPTDHRKLAMAPRARGGGILVLPSRTDISQQAEVGQRLFGGIRGGVGGGVPSRSRGGRGGGVRRLWDPNNPDQKPAFANTQQQQQQQLSSHQQHAYFQTGTGHAQLHFLDTDDEVAGSPPVQQQQEGFRSPQATAMAYYKFQNSDNPYGFPVSANNPTVTSNQRYAYPYAGPYQVANDAYAGVGQPFVGQYRGGSVTYEEAEQQARGEMWRLLRAADAHEVQLGNLLSRDRMSTDGLNRMGQLRADLLSLYEQMILSDIEFSDSQNVDQALWKNVFYQVIERFRQLLKDPNHESNPSTRNTLLTLLDEGALFFDTLLQKLQSVYQFKLEDYMDGVAIRARPLRKVVKYALISAQRCMICQGDIARYREQASDSTNYGKARSWYLKAQQIAPKNGRPYNQLALLAVYTKRKLDAVYYYMRSLAASNPILTAKESLMSLFEEAKRKAEQLERKRKQECDDGSRGPTVKGRGREDRSRVEIWIRPTAQTSGPSHRGGSESSRDSEQDGELGTLSTGDLNKRFILSFLHAHGKLFTKVGMESFAAVAARVLQDFRTLLHHSPSVLSSTVLLQIITINMFTIHNAHSRAEEGEARSVLQEQSTALGLAMFALLVQRCTDILRGMQTGDKEEPMVRVSAFPQDLRELLPSIKVWSDWMLGQPTQWNPPPCGLQSSPDVWRCLADLCNVLALADHEEVPLYKVDSEEVEGDEDLSLLQLKEDRLLAGFVPLLAAPQEPCYTDGQTEMTIAEDCKRVTVLKYFLEALCGQEEPLLAFKGGKYVSVACSPNTNVTNKQVTSTLKESEDVIVEADSSVSASEGDEIDEADDGENGIKELRARRHALVNQLAQEQKRKDKFMAVLQTGGPLELEVQPFFLVPDTNAFVDHLDGLKKLLQSGAYIIVVPLIVITELDGLAKGQDNLLGPGSGGRSNSNVNAAHIKAVQEKARAAVSFLEKGFESREPYLRALTSRGNQLESIAFRSEDTSGQQGNNDDVILSCCLHYCNDKAKDFMPDKKNGTVRLRREVVLLTDDRNLRVKALTRNVPVRDIPAFLSWAKVG
uniref:Telomerase-binding protein EST1A n=1 Tax=Knipowitschia caucasica TaxID=637954 RepID=A0AAV2JCK1_KNICA